jgi:hypothetical protein
MAWSDKIPGPSSMSFIWVMRYAVVQSSVGWKPPVAEVMNLLLNLIHSAFYILSIKLTSCAMCASCLSCMAERATKSDDTCDVSEPQAVHCFKDEPSGSAILQGASIASDACEAIKRQVLLPIWAMSHSVHVGVNVTDDRSDITLELSNMQVTRRARLMPQY